MYLPLDIFVGSVLVLKKIRGLLAVSFLVALVGLGVEGFGFSVLRFFWPLFILGWIGTRFVILNEEVEGRSLNLAYLPRVLVKMLGQMIPGLIIVGLIFSMLGLSFAVLFSRWFVGSLTNASEMNQQQLLFTTVNAMKNPGLVKAFVRSSLWIRALTGSVGVLLLVGEIFSRSVMALMARSGKGLFSSLKLAVKLVLENKRFFGWLLVVIYLMRWLVGLIPVGFVSMPLIVVLAVWLDTNLMLVTRKSE